MCEQSGENVSPHDSDNVEELQAVLRIKNQLVQSLTYERDDLERRFREIGQKYLDLMERHEAMRREMERMPTLEELVKLQTKIMGLEQQLKLCRRRAAAQPICDGRDVSGDGHQVDGTEKG